MAKTKAKRLLSLLLSLAMLVSLAVTPVYAADADDSSEQTASETGDSPAEETSEDSVEETETEAEEETAEESANLTATSDSSETNSSETFTVYYGTTHKYTVEYDENGTYDLTQPYSDEDGYGVSNERLYAGLYTDRTYKTPLDTDEAEVGNGLEFSPEAGETYYVKEISYHYLEIKCLYAWNNNKLVHLWPVTGIDNNNYSEIGFIIDDGDSHYPNDTIDVEESPLEDESTLSGDTQIYETLNVTYPGGDPENVYTDCTNLFGVAGYLAVTQALDETLSNYSGGEEITMQAYYVTLDGVMVTGAVERTLTFKEDFSGFTYVDESVESETSDGFEDTGTITMVLSLAVSDECVLTASVPEETTYTITKYDSGTVSTQEVAEGDEDVEITYAGKEGYLFGGWFEDESCTVAANFSNITGDMTVYAKYVSADYMQVKVATQSKKNVVTALRFFSAVDSKNYAEVGFEYEYDGTKETVEVTKYSTTVSGYTAVKLFAGDVVTGSKLIYNDLSVADISEGTKITVTPYWVTQDGTRVYGTARTVTFTGTSVE